MHPARHQILIGYTTRMFSDGLESIVESSDRFTVAEKGPVGRKLLAMLKRLNTIDILIIELNNPTKEDLANIIFLTETYPRLQILLISLLPRNNLAIKLLESGIGAYILKSCTSNDLLIALNKLLSNDNYFCSDITKTLLPINNRQQQMQSINLTEREKEILSKLVNCKTNTQIAIDIGVSENTVKTHRRNIRAKFGVSNLLGMVRYACRSNLINHGSDGFCIDCPHCSEFQS